MSGISRPETLKIMRETGALGELDINDEDFLGGHGRERSHVAVMEAAYALGQERAIWAALRAVNDSAQAAESVRAVAGRLGVEL